MSVNASSRTQLKTNLLQQIQQLDQQEALRPSSHPEIDQLIYQLEGLNPISQPLHETHRPTLLGTWQLVYASRGTVVTRRIEENLPLPVEIRRLWQRLTASPQDNTPIAAENGVVLTLPLMGEITAIAQGSWQPYEEAESANVSFSAFSLQPTRFLGVNGFNLPKLTLSVLDFFRREALWITPYLDDDLRLGRGATGNLFVFRRETLL
ncbi:MAG: PAP fibrillin [Leptolyngbyaceae cyanobacterium SM2_5_2]|nr:PAP fibrillin [Leptolyngbyaceae cyanobacterium SM2_5_2]